MSYEVVNCNPVNSVNPAPFVFFIDIYVIEEGVWLDNYSTS
jgi:hypothetical protein